MNPPARSLSRWAIVGMALAIVLVALWAWSYGGQLAYRALGLALGTLATVAVALTAPLGRIRLARHLDAGPHRAGDSVAVTLTAQLPLWPWLYLQLEDGVPFAASPRWTGIPLGRRRLAFTYTLTEVPRGVHRFNGVTVTVGDPFGFYSRRRVLAVPSELEVWPRPAAAARPLLEAAGGGMGAGEELLGIRPFQPADRLSQLHAASSARHRRPMVKAFAAAQAGPVLVALEAPWTFDREQFEAAVSMAAGLAESALRAGKPVGLWCHDGGNPVYLPPVAGPRQLPRLLSQLARVNWQAAPPAAGPPVRSHRPLPPGSVLMRITAAGVACEEGAGRQWG